MYRLKKKGEALFFLMELMVISIIIIIFAGATYSSVTSDSKHMTLDIYDLGLFMERIPSIDGNFKHVFEFHNNVNIDFTKNSISLDAISVKTEKKFSVNYMNRGEFQVQESFENVSKLYFYKLGNELYVFDEPNPKIENMMWIKDFNKEEYELFFVSETSLSAFDEDNVQFVLKDVKTQFSSEAVLSNPSGRALWINQESADKKFRIYYNKKGRDFATSWYNKFVIYALENDVPVPELAPLYWNSTLINADIPVMVSKSSSFNEYLGGLYS